jgi:hypothetical protein
VCFYRFAVLVLVPWLIHVGYEYRTTIGDRHDFVLGRIASYVMLFDMLSAVTKRSIATITESIITTTATWTTTRTTSASGDGRNG